MKKAQMRIQQMAFMIIAVFFFFVLVGLFFIGWSYKDIKSNYEELQKEQALSSLKVISNMGELNCEENTELCLDEDKLVVMSRKDYSDIWPVASIRVYQLYPKINKTVLCPAPNCNYYQVYDSKQKNLKEFSTYVSICRRDTQNSYQYEKCNIGKLIVGVKLND